MSDTEATVRNPLLDKSDLPYGLPAFAEIGVEDFRPAIDQGMAEQLQAIASIVADPEPPTFANTLIPLELSGTRLQRALAVFSQISAADTTARVDDLDAELAPVLSAHSDAMMLNSELYQRVEAVQAAGETLDPESAYLLERWLTRFKLAGAALSDADKDQLKTLNSRMAELERRFKTDLQNDSNELALIIDDPADLDGLTTGEISAAAAAAQSRGLGDKHLITLVLPTAHPYLASLTDADVRERLSVAQRARGSRGNKQDTRQTLLEIVKLRAQTAALLGFDNYAALVTADSTAGTPQAVQDLLLQLATPSVANAKQEQKALERSAGRDLRASDWAFYSERVRTAEHDVDLASLRPYFEAERVLQDGVFFAAGKLFGLTFTERHDLKGYHPDVRVFELKEEDGTPAGLYLLDLYARDSKRGGAWMGSFVDQATLAGSDAAVVTNTLNVPKPAPGEATLLTFDETETLFHEFGHAIHGLLARATYPQFAGTEVFTDFVEFPSQFYEMWMLWPQVLANYAVHYQTGEPIPPEIVDRIHASETFNEGFETSEYLGACVIDMAWHSLTADAVPADAEAVVEFDQAALRAAGLASDVLPPRYASPYFAHLFTFNYGASYYSYVWSEVMVADTAKWFADNGGLTRENGEQYRQHVVGFGGTREPLAAYVEWRGRPAPIEPLLLKRGLAAAPDAN